MRLLENWSCIVGRNDVFLILIRKMYQNFYVHSKAEIIQRVSITNVICPRKMDVMSVSK